MAAARSLLKMATDDVTIGLIDEDATPLLSWLARVVAGSEKALVVPNEFSTDEVIFEATHNGVLSLLGHRFLLDKSATSRSSQFRKVAVAHGLQLAGKELLLREELLAAFQLFNQSNIPYLLLKGEALAQTVYPKSYLRERCDTDILLPDKKAAESAWNLLKENGYQRANTLSGEFVGHQFSCNKRLGKNVYLLLDIHSQISDYNFFASTLSFTELYKKRQTVPNLGPGVFGLHPVHALMHACMHRIAHIPHGQENKLIWLYDIHLLGELFNEVDWSWMLQLAKEKKVASACASGLVAAQVSFDSNFPQQHLNSLCRYGKSEKRFPVDSNRRWKFYYQDFLQNKGFRNKFMQLKEHLIPSTAYMMRKYNLKHRVYLPYYYIKRLLLGIKKYL